MLTEAGRVGDNIRCIVLDATNNASVDWRCILRLLVSDIIHSKASEGYVRTGPFRGSLALERLQIILSHGLHLEMAFRSNVVTG